MRCPKIHICSILNISSPLIQNSYDLITILLKEGVVCNITENYSVVSDLEREGEYKIEKGVQIILPDLDPVLIENKVWNPLKERFKLGCAYLHVVGQFRGCIYDFLGKTSCPGSV